MISRKNEKLNAVNNDILCCGCHVEINGKERFGYEDIEYIFCMQSNGCDACVILPQCRNNSLIGRRFINLKHEYEITKK